jgi:polyadenylate-binding protein
LNGEVLIAKYSENKKGRPVRICKYEMKGQVDSKDSKRSLLVKSLDKSITARDLYTMFEEFGEVKSSKLEIDENGDSKGYGYIYYNDEKSAELAKLKLVK